DSDPRNLHRLSDDCEIDARRLAQNQLNTRALLRRETDAHNANGVRTAWLQTLHVIAAFAVRQSPGLRTGLRVPNNHLHPRNGLSGFILHFTRHSRGRYTLRDNV